MNFRRGSGRLASRRTAALALAALALAGCESTRVAPAADATVPLEEDERRLWARAREEEAVLDGGGFLVSDQVAEAYLNGVVRRLQPEPLAGGGQLQVKILLDPRLNAFALPDGAIYIHTGMLARLDNEAQLATVLGHELTHATHRHGLKGFRNLKNKTAFMAAFSAGTAGTGALFGAIGAAAAISGYSRDLEREADANGYRLIVAAGYDSRECPKVFRLLLDESKRSKIPEPFFFGSHPRLEERIASYDQLAASGNGAARPPRTAADDYQAAVAGLLLRNAAAALSAGDHDSALASVRRRLALFPDDEAARLAEAEIHRKRGGPGDVAEALRLFRDLIGRAPDLAEAQRGLGLLLFKSGDNTAAAAAFQRYLALKPAADDRGYIENYLKLCAPKS